MRSPADTRRTPPRVWLERLARLVALALVVWLLADSLRPHRAGDEAAEQDALSAALVRWSTARTPARVFVHLDRAPSPAQRDWLVALRGAGTAVSWWGADDELSPVAAVANPIPDPAGATAVWVAAPAGTELLLGDAIGPLDSVHSAGAGARFVALSAPSRVAVRAGVLTARSAVRDSLVLGRVLVLGGVGWESKFVVASLEERGWRVDARLALSPRGDVLQGDGDANQLDTARYSAVVALDTTALRIAARIERYVRSGGGLVLAGEVAASPRFASLAVGTPSSLIAPAAPFDSVSGEPRRALAFRPIAANGSAVVVERRDSLVAVASRRVERGRVIAIGYEESWRWRLGGGDGALERYREWWSGIVASVAHAGRHPIELRSVVDEAPLVSLVDRLGERGAAAPGPPVSPGDIPRGWILALLAALVLIELASRRLRGAP